MKAGCVTGALCVTGISPSHSIFSLFGLQSGAIELSLVVLPFGIFFLPQTLCDFLINLIKFFQHLVFLLGQLCHHSSVDLFPLRQDWHPLRGLVHHTCQLKQFRLYSHPLTLPFVERAIKQPPCRVVEQVLLHDWGSWGGQRYFFDRWHKL